MGYRSSHQNRGNHIESVTDQHALEPAGFRWFSTASRPIRQPDRGLLGVGGLSLRFPSG